MRAREQKATALMMLASVSGMLGILWHSFRRSIYGLVTTIDVVFIALPDCRWVVGSKVRHVTITNSSRTSGYNAMTSLTSYVTFLYSDRAHPPCFLGFRGHHFLSEEVQPPLHRLHATSHLFQLVSTNTMRLHALAVLIQKPDCLLQRPQDAT